MTGARLYKLMTKIWSGKSLRWGAVPKEDQVKWIALAELIDKEYRR